MKQKKLKVLLVDDEKEFVDSLSERLELRNLDADIAYDGEQALQTIKEGEPDVMVLDLRMPGIDGLEVLRQTKESHPDVRIIVLTGHGTDKDEEEARKLGASVYLKKPIDIDNLVGALNKEKIKVLLVDDEKDFVDSLSERLALRNLDAKTVYDGEQAIQAIKEGEPDVMVLDLRMPGVNGLDVLRRVRKTNPHVQVVVLTGHGTEEEEKLARKLGAVAYMKKPVDIDQLVGTLHKAWKKLKNSRDKMDKVIMAAAFAQAGEVDIARETMAEMMHEKVEDEQQGSGKASSE